MPKADSHGGSSLATTSRPGMSVCDVPASIRDPAPKKNSALRESQHHSPAQGSAWHHSNSPVPCKKQSAKYRKGHYCVAPLVAALSMSALQRAPLSPAHMDSPAKKSEVEELDLLSMLDMFEVARALIAMMALASVDRAPELRPLAQHVAVLSRGKPTMMRYWLPSPRHRSLGHRRWTPLPQHWSPVSRRRSFARVPISLIPALVS